MITFSSLGTIGDWEYINNLKFVELKKEVGKEATQRKIQSKKYKFQNIIKALNYVLELRHSFQHGGMPNPMRGQKCKVDEIVLVKMMNPRHYKKTKIIFSCAFELFKFLPKPQVIFYADGYLKNDNIKKPEN